MSFRLRYGPWALITGASAGIGRAYARALAARGLNLVLLARRADRLQTLAEELRGHTDRTIAGAADSTPIEIRCLAWDLLEAGVAERLRQELRDLEIGLLVNNAGFGFSGAFHELEPQRLEAMVRLNCTVPAALAHAFLPAMRKRGRGGMLMLASTAAFQPTPWMSLYGASKSFDLHLAEALAVEFCGTGVDILAVCPGHTATEFHAIAGVEGPTLGGAATAEAVVESSLRQLGRKWVHVHGGLNRLGSWAPRIGPRSFVARLAGRALSARLGDGQQRSKDIET